MTVEAGLLRVIALQAIELLPAVATTEEGLGAVLEGVVTVTAVGDAIVDMVIVGRERESTVRKTGRRRGVMIGNDMMLPSKRRQVSRCAFPTLTDRLTPCRRVC